MWMVLCESSAPCTEESELVLGYRAQQDSATTSLPLVLGDSRIEEDASARFSGLFTSDEPLK